MKPYTCFWKKFQFQFFLTHSSIVSRRKTKEVFSSFGEKNQMSEENQRKEKRLLEMKNKHWSVACCIKGREMEVEHKSVGLRSELETEARRSSIYRRD